MRGVRFIGREIVEHGLDRGEERRQHGDAGENRAIANLALDHESWPLGHFQSMKLRRAGACSRFHDADRLAHGVRRRGAAPGQADRADVD